MYTNLNHFAWARRKKLSCLFFAFTFFLITIFNLKKYNNENLNLFQVGYLHFYAYFFIGQETIMIKPHLRDFTASHLEFKSACQCSEKSETIFLDKSLQNQMYTIKSSTNKNLNFNFSIDEFESFTFSCDMFSVLRRGPHLKVISYSLYGRDKRYYQSIFQSKFFFSIYHNSIKVNH
jgi:hypothetical protein